MVLAEVSGVASPNGSPNGEIIITAVPEPSALGLLAVGVTVLLVRRRNPIKTKFKSYFLAARHSFTVLCAVALVLQFGVLAGSAQTGDYLYSGLKKTITLNPGTYNITAYGAQGGMNGPAIGGGLGAEMEGEFDFTAATTLTLLVGGAGANGSGGQYSFSTGGGGGGGSFVVSGSTPLVIAGGGGGGGDTGGGSGNIGASGGSGGYAGGPGGTNGGGGGGSGNTGGGGGYSGGAAYDGYPGGSSFLSGGAGGGNGGFGGGGGAGSEDTGGGGGGYSGGGAGGQGQYNPAYGLGGGGGGSIIDSSATMILAEVSGVASPNGSPNGEIIITAVPEPSTLGLLAVSATALLIRNRRCTTL